MKHSYTVMMRLCAILAIAMPAFTAQGAPASPADLVSKVTGTRVDLKWTNGDAGQTLLDCDFEQEEFPAAGWEQKVTNDYAYLCSWFHFPSQDFIQTNNYQDYIHSGEASAMLYFDMYATKGDHESAQDEWLITPAVENASYLDLFYYIDPKILEWGADEEFPDHYYIKVSHDNGTTWTVLWDAVHDAEPELGWHNLVLPIDGDAPAMVAFQGVSDADETIHLLWALDDVKIYSSLSGNDVIEGYTIKLDGETIAEHVKSLAYTDRSVKKAGKHRYEVYAESGGMLSPAASVDVTIADIKLLPPANVSVESTYDEFGESYIISLNWEDPNGEISPSSYSVYCDGLEVGSMLEDTSVEFFGYTKGIYDFQVTAVYNDPDGESEPAGRRIAIDTRYNARGLQASIDNGNVTLKWNAPEDEGYTVSHYEVQRADVNIGTDIKDLQIVDKSVPAGKYRYYVTAVYSDGIKSIPAYTDVDNGIATPRPLPFSENFDSGYLPADWTLENLWDGTPDNMLWQFDDPNGIGVTGDGFDNGFASIDCINAGFYSLEGTVMSPSIDIAGCDKDKLAVTFSYDYASTGFDSEASLEICKDDSYEWENVTDLVSYEPDEDNGGFSPKTNTFQLGDMVGDASSIRLRWHYTGMMDYHLAIDNVVVFDRVSGMETVSDDIVRIIPTQEGIEIYSSTGVDMIEIFSVDGKLLHRFDAGGVEIIKAAIEHKGMAIVKVTAPSGSKTLKVML